MVNIYFESCTTDSGACSNCYRGEASPTSEHGKRPPQSTYYRVLQCTVCPRVGNGTPPPLLPLASVPPFPPPTKGERAHSPAGEGWGFTRFRRLDKKLSTLPSLWTPPRVQGFLYDLTEYTSRKLPYHILFKKFYKRFLERVSRFLRIYILSFKKIYVLRAQWPESFYFLFCKMGIKERRIPWNNRKKKVTVTIIFFCQTVQEWENSHFPTHFWYLKSNIVKT